MSEIRAAKRKNPFAMVSKTLLDDTRLSWTAKGIAAYLVGKPPGWKMRVSDLVKHGIEGKHAVRVAINELRAFGYAQFTQPRENGKVQAGVWEVSDEPEYAPHTKKRKADEPRSNSQEPENRDAENQHHSKNDTNKINSSNNDFSKEVSKTQVSTLKTPIRKPPIGAPPLPQLEGDLLFLADDWKRWQQHCAEKGKPLTALQAEAQIALLWEMTYKESKASLAAAIEGGFTRFLLPKHYSEKNREEPANCAM